MANWKDYLTVLNEQGKAAAWEFAQKNFPRESLDFIEAQRYHVPTAEQKRQSAGNRKAIERELNPEFVAQNCQVGFLKKDKK